MVVTKNFELLRFKGLGLIASYISRYSVKFYICFSRYSIAVSVSQM